MRFVAGSTPLKKQTKTTCSKGELTRFNQLQDSDLRVKRNTCTKHLRSQIHLVSPNSQSRLRKDARTKHTSKRY